MKTFGLYKKQKLCSTRAIEQLFGAGGADFTRLCYPLRAVARRNPGRSSDAPVAFLISVPKKRLRHAVDRVQMRRRIREAFRLRHAAYQPAEGERIDLAFIYVADTVLPYAAVDSAVKRILKSMAEAFGPEQ
ncbi:MAG: ribonuclease P protein component [Muribaculaceae bacterium]|nr:ribonuclease P protein component [Muribaculaceae bacterium]